jgi:hypothetical protein
VHTQPLDKVLLQLIDCRLREGATIDIEGMGSFQLDGNSEIVFKAFGEAKVFLAYAQEDRTQVKKLYRQLQNAGMAPWMDCQKLLPGQNWPRAIEQTIEISDFFIGCFSQNSTAKRGQFQSELAFALEAATRFPQDDFFFVPIRLNDCELPRRIVSTTHYADLFPDWNRGVQKLISGLRRQHTVRNKKT